MKSILGTILAVCLTAFVYAQAPQSLNYQAVARNSQGQPYASQAVAVKFSILEGSANGTASYVETHAAQTNAFGLFSLPIGGGTPVQGTFSTINWASGLKFLKVEIDSTLQGTSQFLSVPFALFAAKTALAAGAGIGVSGNTITNTGDLSNTNELQNLSIAGNSLSISGGNSVTLPNATSPWVTSGSNIYYNAGKVLVGTNTPFNTNPTTLLQVISPGTESALILAGQGGSNHASISLFEKNTNAYWSINHKATANGTLNHHFSIDYDSGNAVSQTMFKIAPDGRVGLGYSYTQTPPSKFSVKGGDVNILDIGSGVIMKSPNGSCWRLTVDNAGQPVFTAITCP